MSDRDDRIPHRLDPDYELNRNERVYAERADYWREQDRLNDYAPAASDVNWIRWAEEAKGEK